MPKQSRYDALTVQHHNLEAALAAEMRRPMPDAFALQRLKRRKLLVKDEITLCLQRMGAARPAPVAYHSVIDAQV